MLNESLGKVDFDLEVELAEIPDFRQKLLAYANLFPDFCIFNDNYPSEHAYPYLVAAIGVGKELKLYDTENAWLLFKKFSTENQGSLICGVFSYDLKNDIEQITSNNEDEMIFPEMHFYIPEIILFIDENKIRVKSDNTDAKEIIEGIKKCLSTDIKNSKPCIIKFESRPVKNDYLSTVEELKEEIRNGNIYEINFCRELLAEFEIDPVKTVLALSDSSPAPFSVFYKTDHKYLICASPERFLLKSGNRLISQPIKGTRRRSLNPSEDEDLKKELFLDKKERAENVMIVDLVRNDLSRTAERESVIVSELYGIYTFPHVHQMISTVESRLNEDFHFSDSIKFCFPMGSMTGAPKLRAMELIEKHEKFKRGLFSGSAGIITPENNFDFNVIIRSILYNSITKKISIRTGSAITAMCDAEKEWEECEIKSTALLNALRAK